MLRSNMGIIMKNVYYGKFVLRKSPWGKGSSEKLSSASDYICLKGSVFKSATKKIISKKIKILITTYLGLMQ